MGVDTPTTKLWSSVPQNGGLNPHSWCVRCPRTFLSWFLTSLLLKSSKNSSSAGENSSTKQMIDADYDDWWWCSLKTPGNLETSSQKRAFMAAQVTST